MATYRVPVDITYPYAGGPGQNVWHVRTTGDAPSGGELQGLTEAIRDFYSAVSNIYAPGVTISYGGQATTVGDDPVYDTSAPAWSVTSTGTGGPLPPANAIVVGWRTPSATRSGRGRTFLGPLSTATVESNTGDITPGALMGIRNAAEALVSDSAGFANGAVGVWSPTDGVIRDITGATVRDVFAVLRSRRD